jgi:UPF0755 protein
MEPIDLKNINQNQQVPQGQGASPRHLVLPWRALFVFALFVGMLLAAHQLIISPPDNFVPGTTINVVRGDSVTRIGEKLEEARIIRSALAFRLLARVSDHASVELGPYLFEKKGSLFTVASRIFSSRHGMSEISITIPEGWTRAKMSERFAAQLPAFDKAAFMSLTEGKEGYLFPETYRFFVTATSGQVAVLMMNEFNKQTAQLQAEANQKNRRWSDVIILASILEGEGRDDNDRTMIADILLRRLARGMRLQIDAPFVYILGKGSAALTQDDLFVESPYNTYRHEGLPPTPISSPGLLSIKAALNPTPNEYLFYLHDKQGQVHFAKTSAEHVRNKMQFLK